MSNKRQGTLISDEKLRASVGCPFQSERRVVVEEQTIDGFFQEGDMYVAPTYLRPDLGDYETIVVWDGVEYETEIITESLPDSIIAYVGNQKMIYGVDTGEPFTLFTFDNGPMIVHAADGSTATSHTISIIQKVPRKLGKEYLPDDVGGVKPIYIDRTTEVSTGVTITPTRAKEIMELWSSGVPVFYRNDVIPEWALVTYMINEEGPNGYNTCVCGVRCENAQVKLWYSTI